VAAKAEVWDVISRFRGEFANLAEVEERELTDRLHSIRFHPKNAEAAPVWLGISEWTVIVEIGKGGRFELGTDEPDWRLLDELLRSAAAGRVQEETRRFSVRTRVRLSDGTVQRTGVQALADLTRRSSEREYGGKRATRRYAPWGSLGG
jgi:hypothetical protein